MEWTDIQITVPQQYAETAEAIATMVSNGGIYIEDYRDLEQQAWEIAHVDLIEQDLLDQPRDIVKVHMYLAPDENPAEILPLFKERLEASGVEYKLETSGIEQEDWQNAWGVEKADAVFSAFNEIPSMTIRVNSLKQPAADFEKLLSEKGIEATHIPYLPEGFTIKSGANHFFGTVLKEGLAYVQ